MNARPNRTPVFSSGFTLVEIMVVVVIIGLLAAMAVPALLRVLERSRATRFVNDLRVIAHAAEQYAAEKDDWPPDGFAAIGPELMPYLPKSLSSSTKTCLGGVWDWEKNGFGVTAAISVHQPTASISQFQLIDRMIDDGDLATGQFQARLNGYMLVLQP